MSASLRAERANEWNRWKRERAPWWVEVSRRVQQGAFGDLEQGSKNWRRQSARRLRFKRKELLEDNGVRFTGSIRVFPSHVRLPRIGKIRPKEPTVKILTLLEERKAPSATISRGADRWYVSLACEVKRPDPVLRDGDP